MITARMEVHGQDLVAMWASLVSCASVSGAANGASVLSTFAATLCSTGGLAFVV